MIRFLVNSWYIQANNQIRNLRNSREYVMIARHFNVLYDSNASPTLNAEPLTEVSDRRQKRDAVTAFKSKKFVYGFIVAFFVLS